MVLQICYPRTQEAEAERFGLEPSLDYLIKANLITTSQKGRKEGKKEEGRVGGLIEGEEETYLRVCCRVF